MLTEGDVEWIKANREEILAHRTEEITVYRRIKTGEDPYTGEPTYETTTEDVDVVWKKYASIASDDRHVVGGVELLEGDVQVSFKPNINPYEITLIERGGVDYKVVTVDDRGLGGLNRYECIVRRVT